MSPTSPTLQKLLVHCGIERAGKDSLLACCQDLLLDYKFETVFIAASVSPEEVPRPLVWLGIEELVGKSLWRVGVEDRVALTQTSFKVVGDVTGPIQFNPHGSLKIQKPGSGIFFAQHHAGRGYLMLGLVHGDTRPYAPRLTEELTELWKEWKPVLWDVAGRVLRQQQLDDRAAEEARKISEEAEENARVKNELPSNPNLPRRSVEMVDSSTRLFNKFFFEETLAVEVERARRYNRSVTLILLSVTPSGTPDEAAGEVLAQQAAETLVKSLRRVDILCRNERFKFALILPDTANEKAAVVARRVFKYFKSLMGERPSAHLNLSSASFPKHAPDSPALMSKAEQLLEQAQAAGANKAVLSD